MLRPVGVHPCGLALDWLRSAYTVKMRTWADDGDVGQPWRWFRAGKDTPFIGMDTFLFSRNWLDARDKPNSGLGEQRSADPCVKDHPWNAGRPPAVYKGDHVCGGDTPAVRGRFRDGADPATFPGIVVLEDGSAACCDTVGQVGRGGAAQGGLAGQSNIYPQTGSGGQKQGGEAHQCPNGGPGPLVQEAWNVLWNTTHLIVLDTDGDCSVCLGSDVPPLPSSIHDEQTWQDTGCEAPVLWHLEAPHDCYRMSVATGLYGYLVYADEACQTLVFHFTTYSGQFCSFTGDTDYASMLVAVSRLCSGRAFGQLGAGGQEQGGEAETIISLTQTGTGGQEQGGSAVQLVVDQFGSGTQGQGGAAAQFLALTQLGTGGQAQGGHGTGSDNYRQLGAGGQEQGGDGTQGSP